MRFDPAGDFASVFNAWDTAVTPAHGSFGCFYRGVGSEAVEIQGTEHAIMVSNKEIPDGFTQGSGIDEITMHDGTVIGPFRVRSFDRGIGVTTFFLYTHGT